MSQYSIYGNPMHLNGNILCAVDVETTGLQAGYHDIAQICILPLNEQYLPSREIIPFNMNLSPKRPENADQEALKKCKLKLADLILEGMDPHRAADLFEEWFEKLKLPGGKKIAPLAHNWPFDRGYLIDWLGPKNFEDRFYHRYRDPMVIGNFCNDLADLRGEQYFYQKLELPYLVSLLHVEAPGRLHDALNDCVAVAEVYKRMLHRGII
jgi:DNA polymerase III epsilon subunit-like protein